jgi:hypothetical protein
MRRSFALILGVVALALPACGGGGGGSNDQAQTLPAAPALTVPGGEQAPPIVDTGTTGDTGATGPTDTTPSPAPSAGSGGTPAVQPTTTVGGGGGGGGGGGAQAPSSAPKTTATQPNGAAQAPSSQKGLSDFCKQNPGACP